MLLRISQKLTKITECFYKILQRLLIFLNFETSDMPKNKHPKRCQRRKALVLTHTKRTASIKKVLNISLVAVYRARKCTFDIRQCFGSVNVAIFETNMLHTRF